MCIRDSFQRVIFGVPVTPLIVEPLQPIAIPFLSDIPLLGPILFEQNILTYLPVSYTHLDVYKRQS